MYYKDFPIGTHLQRGIAKIKSLRTHTGVSEAFSRRFGRRIEAFTLVFAALFFLAFWGSNAEGQGSLLAVFVNDQIEERTLSLSAYMEPSQNQLADLNSIAGFGGPEQPRSTTEVPTIQEGAVLAYSPPLEDYLDFYEEQRSQVITYTVQEGDALSFIASDFGVSVNSILWANQISDANSISPGQTLKIPPVNGVVYTVERGDTVQSIAETYDARAESIIAFNTLPANGALIEGDEIIIPDGILPDSRRTTTAPAKRSFSYLPKLDEFFIAPTTGYNWGRIHGRNGIDVANSYGTPIVAAADGVVIVADSVGWNGGFGQFVKVEHANGTVTLYAHASQILVAVGDSVTQGQHIALMGTTGRSTGNHLHFEVHGAQNPLAKY